MQLSPEEAEHFYQLWFPLLHFVNEQRHLVPSFPARWTPRARISPSVALPLRDAVWEDDSLREAFIKANPAKLSPADLNIVKSWDYRIADDFFIFRHLKKYTVFLSQGPARAYGVLGLMGSLEETVGPNLPTYVNAVLLPFGDRIIYDGLLQGYNVMFGGGIRADLEETYRDILEREGIITSLLPVAKSVSSATQRKDISARNKRVLTAFQKELGQSGLSPKMMEEHTANIAAFAEDYLLAQQPPRGLRDVTAGDLEGYLNTAKANPVSLKRFIQFLRDTGRMEWRDADALLKQLKGKRK